MRTPVEELTTAQLVVALRAHTVFEGTLTTAAHQLLIDSEVWLQRLDFRRRFIDYQADPAIVGDQPYACIRWDEAVNALECGDLPARRHEANVLHLAASLADASVSISLRYTLRGLGAFERACITAALRTALR